MLIVRRGRGRFAARLPDGLDPLAPHNLLTFKSLRESLDAWTMKELIGHYVAYRKFVSPSHGELRAESRFRLYALCARFPQGLAGQVPWHERQPGVYDCQWGTDVVRIIVAGQLPREPHNAALHLFSASQELQQFGGSNYRPRSADTSRILGELSELLRKEGFAMTYTMADFRRDSFMKMTREEQREVLEALPAGERRKLLESLPLEDRLAGLSQEEIQAYFDRLAAERPQKPRKSRRKP